MRKLTTLCCVMALIVLVQFACERPTPPGQTGERGAEPAQEETQTQEEIRTDEFFEGRGIGPFTEVELNDPLDMDMVETGRRIHNMQCASCHHVTDRMTVGPGIKGITERRTPEWIMNMITNVDVMLDEDPVARRLLEECKVRMPDQQTSAEDARAILEFYYYNDQG